VNEGHLITLSWISDSGREERNLSPVVSILAEPNHFSSAVRKMVGGIKISNVNSAAALPPIRSCLNPLQTTVSDQELSDALEVLDARAIASSLICSRRFAIQWALGNSSAFSASHHQSMLFGNTIGSVSRRSRMSEEDATKICDDLWRFMTNGERASSRSKARVVATGPTADPEVWPLTLGGSRNGDDVISRAYQHALQRNQVPRNILHPNVVAPKADVFLPARNENAGDIDICRDCPVKSRCLVASDAVN
jgi:hypothetical protein